MREKIIPHLWFNTEALAAAEFYTSIFPNSKIVSKMQLKDTPSGDCDIIDFEIMGFGFQALSAGSSFTLNPSISIKVNFDPSRDRDARKRMDEIWEKLLEGGKALVPLDAYPFSEHFGWVEDRYGFSWQLFYNASEGEDRPLIVPAFLFVSDNCEVAEEATNFYLSVFKNTERGAIERFPAGMEPVKEGSVMNTDFTLEGQLFTAMDGSAAMHHFAFNEAVSLMVHCENQEEIDYYWEKLSALPEAEQCGWVKDKYGVSWQIVPANLNELISANPEKTRPALLAMKKLIIADLEKAGK